MSLLIKYKTNHYSNYLDFRKMNPKNLINKLTKIKKKNFKKIK